MYTRKVLLDIWELPVSQERPSLPIIADVTCECHDESSICHHHAEVRKQIERLTVNDLFKTDLTYKDEWQNCRRQDVAKENGNGNHSIHDGKRKGVTKRSNGIKPTSPEKSIDQQHGTETTEKQNRFVDPRWLKWVLPAFQNDICDEEKENINDKDLSTLCTLNLQDKRNKKDEKEEELAGRLAYERDVLLTMWKASPLRPSNLPIVPGLTCQLHSEEVMCEQMSAASAQINVVQTSEPVLIDLTLEDESEDEEFSKEESHEDSSASTPPTNQDSPSNDSSVNTAPSTNEYSRSKDSSVSTSPAKDDSRSKDFSVNTSPSTNEDSRSKDSSVSTSPSAKEDSASNDSSVNTSPSANLEISSKEAQEKRREKRKERHDIVLYQVPMHRKVSSGNSSSCGTLSSSQDVLNNDTHMRSKGNKEAEVKRDYLPYQETKCDSKEKVKSSESSSKHVSNKRIDSKHKGEGIDAKYKSNNGIHEKNDAVIYDADELDSNNKGRKFHLNSLPCQDSLIKDGAQGKDNKKQIEKGNNDVFYDASKRESRNKKKKSSENPSLKLDVLKKSSRDGKFCEADEYLSINRKKEGRRKEDSYTKKEKVKDIFASNHEKEETSGDSLPSNKYSSNKNKDNRKNKAKEKVTSSMKQQPPNIHKETNVHCQQIGKKGLVPVESPTSNYTNKITPIVERGKQKPGKKGKDNVNGVKNETLKFREKEPAFVRGVFHCAQINEKEGSFSANDTQNNKSIERKGDHVFQCKRGVDVCYERSASSDLPSSSKNVLVSDFYPANYTENDMSVERNGDHVFQCKRGVDGLYGRSASYGPPSSNKNKLVSDFFPANDTENDTSMERKGDHVFQCKPGVDVHYGRSASSGPPSSNKNISVSEKDEQNRRKKQHQVGNVSKEKEVQEKRWLCKSDASEENAQGQSRSKQDHCDELPPVYPNLPAKERKFQHKLLEKKKKKGHISDDLINQDISQKISPDHLHFYTNVPAEEREIQKLTVKKEKEDFTYDSINEDIPGKISPDCLNPCTKDICEEEKRAQDNIEMREQGYHLDISENLTTDDERPSCINDYYSLDKGIEEGAQLELYVEKACLEPTRKEEADFEPMREEEADFEPMREEEVGFEAVREKEPGSEVMCEEKTGLEPTCEEESGLEPPCEEEAGTLFLASKKENKEEKGGCEEENEEEKVGTMGKQYRYDIATLLHLSESPGWQRPLNFPVVDEVSCEIHNTHVLCDIAIAVKEHIRCVRKFYRRKERNKDIPFHTEQTFKQGPRNITNNAKLSCNTDTRHSRSENRVEDSQDNSSKGFKTGKRRVESEYANHEERQRGGDCVTSSEIFQISEKMNNDERMKQGGHTRGKTTNVGSRSGRPPVIFHSVDYNMLLKWNIIQSPDDLALELLAAKGKLLELLNNVNMSEEFVFELVHLFSKIVHCKRRHNLLSVLSLLKDSFFVLKHVPCEMLCLARGSDEAKSIEFCNSMMSIMFEYFRSFPSSFTNMPLDVLVMLVSNLPSKHLLEEKVGLLLQQREDLIRKTLLRELEDAESRNKPPNNFRDLPTFPTAQDILSREKPFLRPVKTIGRYDDDHHYLDVQFRLLREDLVAPLREGIQEVVRKIPMCDRKHYLKVYDGVQILHANCTNNGLTYRIRFETQGIEPDAWRYTKRLIFGSLVCLSNDKFKTMIFATITDRDPEDLKEGLLDIRFCERRPAQKYCRNNDPMTMVETPSYFEAYRHVLNAMKEIKNVPLHNHIVKCKIDISCPRYLAHDKDITYDLRGCSNPDEDEPCATNMHSVALMKKYQWPDFKQTNLNKSQLKAFMHAITEEFSLIQGPPGTGKTYVGLHIADTLLRNKKYWNIEETVPMLIVCYTNHALDQFLKGLISMGHKKIIRVGGRSCEELKIFNLKNAVKDCRYGACSERLSEVKRAARWEKDRVTTEITPYADGLKTLYDNMIRGNFLNYETLMHVMPRVHQQHMSGWVWRLNELRVPVFDVFLGLCRVSREDLMSIKTVENHANKDDAVDVGTGVNFDETIEIKGEGDVLTDRWAADVNEYKPYGHSTSKGSVDLYGNTSVTILDKDGCKVPQPSQVERKCLIRESLMVEEMSDEEALKISDPWQIDFKDRWRLYKYWVKLFTTRYANFIDEKTDEYEHACATLNEIYEQEEEMVLRHADVIAMTTTCAAKYRTCLNSIKPKIVIIEEAAEVLEAHVVTSLSDGVEHLVLIGDHKQLQPNPAVYELAKKYSLEVSLFERMINNGMNYNLLDIQHRMRPGIARLLHHVYPHLNNHSSVLNLPNVLGVDKNITFVNHRYEETDMRHIKSKANIHEAEFVKSFCLYLLQQGYKRSQITILTGYTGQLIAFKRMMPRTQFEGVRVTALDNYQGEENDIILLSLVRSNREGKIGFMKTENRICVALSRAKMGLYVIGNFEMFENGSELWMKIIKDVRGMSALKDYLKLSCQNHPRTKTKVTCGKDFYCVPEGGCTVPCEYRLDCGHACQKACHPLDLDHENYACSKLCDKILSCGMGHKCGSICHKGLPCEPCRYPISKVLPRCGHVQVMECSTNPETFICEEECGRTKSCGHICLQACGKDCDIFICKKKKVKKLKSCEHQFSIPCYMDTNEVVCTAKCNTTLACSHRCSGSCGECKQGRLHVKCAHACTRLLVCSHLCDEPCVSTCPPCRKKCENRCAHSVCGKRCGEVCEPCIEPCKWRCKHFKCSKTCSEMCDRARCDEPCRKKLPCGHTCIGLCGDLCPDICRVCHKDRVEELFFGTENEPGARFVTLQGCNHTFEVTALDKWMERKPEESIKLKECPKCKTPIRLCLRYGNIIKSILLDIDKVKKRISDCKKTRKHKLQGYTICGEIFRCEMKLCELAVPCVHGFPQKEELQKKSVLRSLLVSPVLSIRFIALIFSADNLNDLSLLMNQAAMWKSIWTLRKAYEGSKALHFHSMSADVEQYLVQKLSRQQYDQLVTEFKRLELYVHAYKSKNDLLKSRVRSDADNFDVDVENLNSFIELFQSSELIPNDELDQIEEKVKYIRELWGLSKLTASEKLMVRNAIGLGKGHWFKCREGHFYAIGECGGAMEKGKCPECGSDIGGTDHVLQPGNFHAPEFDA